MSRDYWTDVIKLTSKIENQLAYHDVLCGEMIGEGGSRIVYDCALDTSCVVKIDHSNSNDNVIEWEIWDLISKYDEQCRIQDYFAPCVRISDNGRILIMKKVEPVTIEEAPEKVPQFFTDFNISNFGMYEGRFVCCDYATVLIRLGWYGFKEKMRKVKWRE